MQKSVASWAGLAALAGTVACGGTHVGAAGPSGPPPAELETVEAGGSPSASIDHARGRTSISGDASSAVAADAGEPRAGTISSLRRHEPGRGVTDIRALVVAHRDEARACYDRALPNHPGLEGDLVLKWTIDPKGTVSEVTVDNSRSQIADVGVADCIGDIIKRIQFAPSPDGYETRASYPFNFHPHKHGRTTEPSGQ